MQYLLNNPVILVALILVGIPAYIFTRYLEKKIQPRQSFTRFLLYLFIVILLAFVLTFLFAYGTGLWLRKQNLQ